MVKKVLLSVLVITLLMVSVALAAEFTDMNLKSYPTRYSDAIEYLSKNEVIKGYPDGTFKPTNSITRAEAVKIIVTAFDLKLKDGNNTTYNFEDVKGKWSEQYVKIGVSNQVIKGYEDGTFKPDNNVTYGELVAILCRLKEKDVTSEADGSWYTPYMEAAEELGFFRDYYTNDLVGTSRARRDNVALIVYNALHEEKIEEKEENKPTPTPTTKQTESKIDTKRIYSAVAGEKFTERGTDYITLDCFTEGEMTFKVVNVDKMPANKSLVIFKISSNGNTSIQKEFKINSIDDDYLLVKDTEETLVAFDGIDENMDVEEKTYKYGSKEIKINKMDYYLAEVEENKDGEYEFVGCEAVSLEDLPFEEDDRVFFDNSKLICIILRGIEVEESSTEDPKWK